MEFNIISFIFIYSPADSRKPWLPYRLVCQSGEGLLRGDTGRDRDRDGGEERSRQGGGQSQSEEALGAEVSAILGRQRRPRVDGEEVEAEQAGVSRDPGGRGPESRADGGAGGTRGGPGEDIRSWYQTRQVAGRWAGVKK